MYSNEINFLNNSNYSIVRNGIIIDRALEDEMFDTAFRIFLDAIGAKKEGEARIKHGWYYNDYILNSKTEQFCYSPYYNKASYTEDGYYIKDKSMEDLIVYINNSNKS